MSHLTNFDYNRRMRLGFLSLSRPSSVGRDAPADQRTSSSPIATGSVTFLGHEFEYWADSRSWWRRLAYRNLKFATAVFGGSFIVPPVISLGWRGDVPKLALLGQWLGFDDLTQKTLARHQQRMLTRGLITLVPLCVGLTVSACILIALIRTTFFGNLLKSNDVTSLLVVAVLPSLVPFLGIAMITRIASVLIEKRFADSLCAVVVIYLLLELRRDDVLTAAASRAALFRRIDDLVRNTRLLAVRHSVADAAVQSWLTQHSERIARDIRERQRWLLMPVDGTLAEVRRYFGQVAPMFIHGTFGQFVWSTPEIAVTREATNSGWLTKVVGVGLPLLGLLAILFNHQRMAKLGVDNSSTIVALFLVWILVGIDAALRLGVVANVLSLLKGVKDLK